ncbi:hypothetical protein DFH27DRAFT_396636 [Peziza echinospora]|nr:hypothetical protein DFH27DRAFT_396636 [Peziza echinospora]
MSGRVKNLLLGKKDPTNSKLSNEDKKRNKDCSEPPQSPRSPLSPGFQLKPLNDIYPPPTSTSPTPQQQHHPPRTSSSQQSNTSSTMSPAVMAIHAAPQAVPSSGRKPEMERPIEEERRARERSASKASSSASVPKSTPRTGGESPPNPIRPSPSRSSSQEGNFLTRVKASRQAAQTYGGKAAKITAKATSTTAKVFGEKSSKAWGKIKTKAKSSKDSQQIVPQSQYLGNFKPRSKVKRTPIDVWGMTLKEATLKTRVIREISSEADAAAYWTPAVAFRCLQYLNINGPQELGLYRVSGSTAVVDDLKADFIHSYDVDISLNPPNDIHTVTSLLKGYFRALPEALFPAESQKRIYDQCKEHPESEKPPQCFLDELSRLPPYNYYMLYLLSAHLSNVNRQSDINKMNLSNLGMIFCSTLRIDRFCFNWLVGHWADCWQGCWTENEELEKTDPVVLKGRPNNSTDHLNSPATTFTTHGSVPTSPAPPSTAPQTPATQSTLSHDTPVGTPLLVQSPGGLSVNTAISKRSEASAHSAPPTPHSQSAPTTPFTPASFLMGDDQRMMVHAASDIIEEYVDEDSDAESNDVTPKKVRQRRKPTSTIDEKPEDEQAVVILTTPKKESKSAASSPKVPAKELKKEEHVHEKGTSDTSKPTSQQPEIRLVSSPVDAAQSPKISSPKIDSSTTSGSPKASGSRPPNIILPPPPHLDATTPKATLPIGLHLLLPPLTPMSPLIATMDQKSS